MKRINMNTNFKRFNFTSETIAKTISFRRFKTLSLLICIFLLVGCSPRNTGEKHTLIVSDVSPTFNGDGVRYTLVSATREETIESAIKDPFRAGIIFTDEYGKFNIGDTVVIVKNNQYEK